MAKRRIPALITAFVLVFSMVACGRPRATSRETQSVAASSVEQATSRTNEAASSEAPASVNAQTAATGNAEPITEVTNLRIVPQQSFTGGTDILVLATIENTGEVPVLLNNMSFDVSDESGALLKNQSLVTPYPNVLNPGDTAYVCEGVVNSTIDTSFTADQIGSIDPIYRANSHAPRKEIDVTISDAALNEKMTFPNFVCRVTNNGAEELSLVYVACPVISADGELLTVILSIINSIAPGETVSVDQMAMQYDESGDYTTATIQPIVYVYEMF